jgi:DNA-binding transcriptional LysR family regulator
VKLPDLEAWAVFACVNEHRSFTAAAAALGTSKATVSKAISRLEAHLGAALFHRTSRQLTLTQAGAQLAPRAAAILAEAVGAEEAARDEASAPSGLVRIAAPMSFGLKHLGPALADFLAQHPGIALDVHLSDERVDIIAGGYDIAIRIAAMPDSSLRARRIGDVVGHVVAAPAYLERHGRPRHPADLASHAVFAYANLPNGGALTFAGPGGEKATVRPAGPFRANSGDLFLPALRAGVGIAMLPDFIVDEDIAAGRLESLLPGWSAASPAGLHIVSPPSDPRPRRVTLLIDYLADRLKRLCAAR